MADSARAHNAGDFQRNRVQYGYMWWFQKIAGPEVFWAAGSGGQYLMVVPDLDTDVLCTSDWQQPQYPELFALVETFILPSVVAK